MTNIKTVNGKKFVSFKTKIVLCVLFALIMGLLSSFVAFQVGVIVVDEFFLSEEAEAERALLLDDPEVRGG